MAYSLMSHIINPTKEEGGQQESLVSDDNVQQLLLSILKELKKMNLHLATITDMVLTNSDVET